MISGVNNIKSFTNEKNREITDNWEHKKFLLDNTKQVEILNKLFLNQDFDGKKQVEKEIKKKMNSYKSQDIKKNRMNKKLFITFEQIVEKLVISKLKCYYCKCNLCLLNKNKLQKNMWTLDRINNDLSHTNDNTCISCLKCNLQKRKRNHEDFKFTKQLKIKKTNFDD